MHGLNWPLISAQAAQHSNGSVAVRVLGARDLNTMDLNGKPDPYVVVQCGQEQHTTQVTHIDINL